MLPSIFNYFLLIKDAIEYVTNLEGPISIEDLARDIFQEVDEDNIEAVRISLSRYAFIIYLN